jgi:hypothetical protein
MDLFSNYLTSTTQQVKVKTLLKGIRSWNKSVLLGNFLHFLLFSQIQKLFVLPKKEILIFVYHGPKICILIFILFYIKSQKKSFNKILLNH